VKVVASFSTLMKLAKEVGDARRSGDKERLAEAERAHDAYKEICLKADELHTGYRYGDLY